MTQIKTKIIETPKVRVLVVGGLPEDAREIAHGRPLINSMISYKSSIDNYKYTAIPIPTADWRLLGKLSEISEEQWMGIVEETDNPFWYGQGYPFIDYKRNDNCFKTATESGLSLIESEVCLKNPHEKPVMPKTEKTAKRMALSDSERELWRSYSIAEKAWQAAEDQVYRNPIIFWEKK